MNQEKEQSEEDYLKSELIASMRREELLSSDLKFSTYLKRRIKKSKLYNIAKPNTLFGKIIRLPRTFLRVAKNPTVIKEISKKKELKIDPISLEPWNLSLQDRINIFKKAKKDNKKIAIYYAEKFDSSTFRYRCYNTMQITRKSKMWQAVYFNKKETESIFQLIKDSDILIIGRQSEHDKIIEKLIKLAQKNKIKTAFDIDDLIFDSSILDSFLASISEKNNITYWAGYIGGVEKICKRVDCFISTNEFLKNKLEKKFNKKCFVISNFLNDEQIQSTEAYLLIKNNVQDFLIGYFSGSPTHAKDLALIMPDILNFLKKHENAKLMVVGYMKFDKQADKYIKNGQIIFKEMVDFRKLQRLNVETDVNLAPLVINDFTNCKSELKFFEAAIAETPTIASPTYAFKTSIKDGETGFLCYPGQWYNCLEDLYSHPEKRQKVAKAAKKYCLENYYGDKVRKKIEDAYDAIKKES